MNLDSYKIRRRIGHLKQQISTSVGLNALKFIRKEKHSRKRERKARRKNNSIVDPFGNYPVRSCYYLETIYFFQCGHRQCAFDRNMNSYIPSSGPIGPFEQFTAEWIEGTFVFRKADWNFPFHTKRVFFSFSITWVNLSETFLNLEWKEQTS